MYFMDDSDYDKLMAVQDFNEFDLYSKEDTDLVITDEIKNYYNELLNEFFRGELQW